MTLVYANIASLSVISWQFLKERFYILKKHFTSDYKVWKWFWKKFPDLKIFSLILAENPLFFPDFPDWKKSSKFSLNSLISLIGGNPVWDILLVCLKKIGGNSIRWSHIGDNSIASYLFELFVRNVEFLLDLLLDSAEHFVMFDLEQERNAERREHFLSS